MNLLVERGARKALGNSVRLGARPAFSAIQLDFGIATNVGVDTQRIAGVMSLLPKATMCGKGR